MVPGRQPTFYIPTPGQPGALCQWQGRQSHRLKLASGKYDFRKAVRTTQFGFSGALNALRGIHLGVNEDVAGGETPRCCARMERTEEKGKRGKKKLLRTDEE